MFIKKSTVVQDFTILETTRSECVIREYFDTNEYPNIFESKNLDERMSEYIHMENFTGTNVRINILIENCANIRIHLNICLVFAL